MQHFWNGLVVKKSKVQALLLEAPGQFQHVLSPLLFQHLLTTTAAQVMHNSLPHHSLFVSMNSDARCALTCRLAVVGHMFKPIPVALEAPELQPAAAHVGAQQPSVATPSFTNIEKAQSQGTLHGSSDTVCTSALKHNQRACKTIKLQCCMSCTAMPESPAVFCLCAH